MVFRRMLCGTGLISLMIACAGADALPLALDVSGNITMVTDKQHWIYHFSEADVKALPVYTIETSTNWTPRSVWQGPLLQDILNKVGGHGTVLQMYALDDYKVEIPVSDLRKYGVILAYAKDRSRLTVNGFGPFMVIYPRDQYPEELNKASAEKRFIWQVWKIVVK
jgi:hypothetical protein